MAKPVIGLVPLWDENKQSYWMLPGYMKGIAEAGGIPIMLPLNDCDETIEQLVEICDGIIFTGGQDVCPEVYGAKAEVDNLETCPQRDSMEVKLLKKALDADKRILGICRGLQFINAALGGNLYQDLPTQHPSDINHRQPAAYDEPSHDVALLDDTPLGELASKGKISVNSCHHQAIKELAPCLRPMAVSDDELIEAFYMPERDFVWGVQWHPEFMYEKDEISRKIFDLFISSCR